jgi:hypothetical protein
MHLEGKELCGKNVYCFEKDNKIIMHHFNKKVAELQFNNSENVTHIKIYKKRYVKNILLFIDLKKNLTFDDIIGLPIEFKNVDQLKERLPLNKILYYGTILNSLTLVKYAVDREVEMDHNTFVHAAKHSKFSLLFHLRNNVSFPEEGMIAALEHKNYATIKLLCKKIKSVEKYIELISTKEDHKKIKEMLIKELATRYKR